MRTSMQRTEVPHANSEVFVHCNVAWETSTENQRILRSSHRGKNNQRICHLLDNFYAHPLVKILTPCRSISATWEVLQGPSRRGPDLSVEHQTRSIPALLLPGIPGIPGDSSQNSGFSQSLRVENRSKRRQSCGDSRQTRVLCIHCRGIICAKLAHANKKHPIIWSSAVLLLVLWVLCKHKAAQPASIAPHIASILF